MNVLDILVIFYLKRKVKSLGLCMPFCLAPPYRIAWIFFSTRKSFIYINNKSKWKFEVISTTPIITIFFKLTLTYT